MRAGCSEAEGRVQQDLDDLTELVRERDGLVVDDELLFLESRTFQEYSYLFGRYLGVKPYIVDDAQFKGKFIDIILSDERPLKVFFNRLTYWINNIVNLHSMKEYEGIVDFFAVPEPVVNTIFVEMFSGKMMPSVVMRSYTRKVDIPSFSSPAELEMKLQLAGRVPAEEGIVPIPISTFRP